MTIHDLDTPTLIADLDIVERNLTAMQAACDAAGVALRPHIKTHKIPEFARWQLDLGAVGLCCAKLGEAEVMLDQAGCRDIFLAYPLVGEAKFERLRGLLDRAEFRLAIDSLEQARLLSTGLRGASVKVRLNVDTGLERDGFTAETALAQASAIADLPGLELVGIFTHEGHAGRAGGAAIGEAGRIAARRLVEVAEELRRRGLPCAEVAPGATPTALAAASVPGVTEVRPGTYIFNDAGYMVAMGLTPADCAVRVITTVVDRPTPTRVILDGGSKTFFADRKPPFGRAFCPTFPELILDACSEEHGHAEWTGEGAAPVRVGDRLEWIPTHVCPVVNLFDELIGVRGEQVEQVYRVAARGRVS